MTDLKVHAKAAKGASKLTTPNFPPQLLLGHMAIESSWGKNVIGKNNYFGMKYVPERHTEVFWKPTTEYLTYHEFERLREQPETIRFLSGKPVSIPSGDGFTKFKFDCLAPFADFPTLEDAYADVAKLLGCVYYPNKSAYKIPWRKFRDKQIGWQEFAIEYGKIYATGPDYGNLLIKIANQKNITEALK